MDYAYYILAVLVIGLLCLSVIRLVTRNRHSKMLLEYQKSRERTEKPRLPANAPWGWPHHVSRKHPPATGLSGGLRSFTDRLIREKQIADATRADLRYSNSIRALLEDRYGRVNRDEMPEIQYQKVRWPLLRDPSEPHDQMDNLGTAEAERIRRRLQYLRSMQAAGGGNPGAARAPRNVELKDIRQPWGW